MASKTIYMKNDNMIKHVSWDWGQIEEPELFSSEVPARDQIAGKTQSSNWLANGQLHEHCKWGRRILPVWAKRSTSTVGKKGQYGGREPEGTQQMDPAIKEKMWIKYVEFYWGYTVYTVFPLNLIHLLLLHCRRWARHQPSFTVLWAACTCDNPVAYRQMLLC